MAESSPADEAPDERMRRDAAVLEQRLRAKGAVTAFCHENPDGDTIGAAVAMARAAQQLGCRSEVVAVDGVPPVYGYLTDGLAVNSRPTFEPGLAFMCDAATLERAGTLVETYRSWFAAATIVNIDHHITNAGFGHLNFVDPDAAASCQVVAWLLPQIGVTLDAPIASAILTGVIRDSHGFSTAATTAATFRAAATALEAGAPLEPIYRAVMLELPLTSIDLWGYLLSDVKRELDGRIVWTLLTSDAIAATGAEQHDAEGVAEFLARGIGVEIGILFRELGGRTRVSLRTGPSVNAAAIAATFGGGGHTRRAGCTIEATADVAIPVLLDACRMQLQT